MGCFHSSGGDSSSRDRNRNRNRNTSDNPTSDPRTAAQRELVRKGKQPIVANEPVVETNPQNRPEDNDAERIDENDLQNMLEDNEIRARRFTFAELQAATGNFRSRNILGVGGFGKVYKGKLADSGQFVAIKRLNPEGEQGDEEFLNEVLTLSMCDHPNLIKLIGFCAEGDERLLVYEYMRLGSLDNHLYGYLPSKKELDWNARMKIAVGIASGLEYLHDQLNPPIIYRDLKTSNILLDEEFNAKLSDFGMAKKGPVGDKSHVTTRVMGTYGYCAPEYAMTGHLTQKSDVFSFGVVMLELITGRKAVDEAKTGADKNLVSWTRPLLTDSRNFPGMVDPALKEQFPGRELYQAFSIAAMCIEYQPIGRPLTADVLSAALYVASKQYDPKIHRRPRKGSEGAGPSGVKKDEQDEG